ncbi:hypothetical protein [Streptomyces sp. NPDC018031]|uniref:hypothetical protein n=1 Tax=Streptomyces sp. NPDC018031 TaxID=3365033 RepID=UPI00378A091E
MTVALFSRGKASRAAAAACAVTLGLVALTACDKPTPVATVTVGSHSEVSEATKGCYDEDGISKKDINTCLNKETGETLTVHPGERVRIGVDPKIAEDGWVVVTGPEPVMNDESTETYRSFDGEKLFETRNQMGQTEIRDEVTLAVVQLGEKDTAPPVGMWHFKLKLEP